MSIKKVMIISALPHTKIGGVETYNRKLIKIFNDLGYKVTEYVLKSKDFIENQKDVAGNLESEVKYVGGKSYFYPIKAKRIIEKEIDSFDIVINASKLFTNKIVNHKGHILVQHTPYEDYVPNKKTQRIKWFFDRVFLGLGVKGDVFDLSSHSVFYSRFTNVKNYKGSKNIPLSSNIIKHKRYTTDFVWAARLHDSQKGIKNLIKINQNLSGSLIEIIGDGEDKKTIEKEFGPKWLGYMKQKDLRNKMAMAKGFLLTSNYEGAAYTVTEALCSGTPVVLFDTFRHAKFYGQCKSVFLVNPFDIKDFTDAIEKINSWSITQRNEASRVAARFSERYLSDEIFFDKWKKLVKEL